jgi:hypothetical protein
MTTPIRKAYFHGRHVDLSWYGKRGIKKKIKGDYGSNFPCIQDIMDFRLDVIKRDFLGKKCVCDIGKRGGEGETTLRWLSFSGLESLFKVLF